MALDARCPGCGAPALPTPTCPQCGARYHVGAPEPQTGRVWQGAAEDARHERQIRLIAPPVMLGLAWLVYQTDNGRALFRTFISMWLHELGHAIAAWLSGFAAFPGPWRTSIDESRALWVTLLVLAALGTAGFLAHRAGRVALACAAAAVALATLALTFGLRVPRAQAFILFSGDGGALVLGALFTTTFYVAQGSHLHQTWLRWGFLFIGAFGFMDPFTLWWRARRDLEVIGFGQIEGVGDSDPTRLVDDHLWSVHTLVGRYVALAVACLLVILLAYGWGAVRRPRPAEES